MDDMVPFLSKLWGLAPEVLPGCLALTLCTVNLSDQPSRNNSAFKLLIRKSSRFAACRREPCMLTTGTQSMQMAVWCVVTMQGLLVQGLLVQGLLVGHCFAGQAPSDTVQSRLIPPSLQKIDSIQQIF